MLLNNEINITVTNNGKDNKVQLSLDPNYKLKDVMTCMELANIALKGMLEEYLESLGGVTEKEFSKIFEKVSLDELYDAKNK